MRTVIIPEKKSLVDTIGITSTRFDMKKCLDDLLDTVTKEYGTIINVQTTVVSENNVILYTIVYERYAIHDIESNQFIGLTTKSQYDKQ